MGESVLVETRKRPWSWTPYAHGRDARRILNSSSKGAPVTSNASDFIKLASFSSVFEADLAVAALESAHIPAFVVGHQNSGVFGAGFQGPVVGGVEVKVPTATLDDAWAIVASLSPRASAEDGQR